jgi:Lrp/AsnC family transcriptional regulator for asnA, asnC and gidA
MSEIDKTDRAIVDLLMNDGRMSAADISRALGNVSERAVRYRIDRLLSQGIIRIGAIPVPQALGYAVVADVFIQVDAIAILDVARQLTQYECVSYVGCSTGESDLSVQVVGRDNAEVYSFVTEVVAVLPAVRKTTTVIVPLVLKDVYQWRIPAGACTEAAPSKGPGEDNEDRHP